jgi:hypothetical protein
MADYQSARLRKERLVPEPTTKDLQFVVWFRSGSGQADWFRSDISYNALFQKIIPYPHVLGVQSVLRGAEGGANEGCGARRAVAAESAESGRATQGGEDRDTGIRKSCWTLRRRGGGLHRGPRVAGSYSRGGS